ncbi:hypothetical protein BsLM_1883 [Bacillus sp. LM 4-2]|nr:hypothetical protein BsLM_1883 [Bacillus sp. LM 4-2]BAO93408.1 hypothetical protein BSNT_08356 [Bacillus subtilis subsp. natto BEST195]GAK81569.1 hypothetical protein BSMD_034850 [Bacillus subtilis Miyagi-4]
MFSPTSKITTAQATIIIIILAAAFYCKMWLRRMERSSIPEQL